MIMQIWSFAKELPNLLNALQQDTSDKIENENPIIKIIDNVLDGQAQKR